MQREDELRQREAGDSSLFYFFLHLANRGIFRVNNHATKLEDPISFIFWTQNACISLAVPLNVNSPSI